MHRWLVIAMQLAATLALLSGSWAAGAARVLGQEAAPPGAATITLATGQDWVATSVSVEVGDQVRIRASGTSPMGPQVPAGAPAGNDACVPTEQFVAPNLPCYALIGRIDQTAPFLVGEAVTFNVKMPGQLFLGVNDDFFTDNEGAWEVVIEVVPAAAGEATPVATPAATPAPAEPTPAAPATAETPVAPAILQGGQQVTLLQGTCREPIAVVMPVGTMQAPSGAFRGQVAASPVASVTGVLPYAFATLLSGDYAIAVTAPVDAGGGVLVCGDLGNGVLEASEASFGLSPEDDAGWAGIAYLAPSGIDPGATVVSVFIAPGLTGGSLE